MSFTKLFITFFNNHEIHLFSNDYWTLLFMGCLSLFAPVLWVCVPFYLCLRIKKKSPFVAAVIKVRRQCPFSDAVLYIQRNHINSLSEAIESNPELLYGEYKNQNLLMWCKHYNNFKAQSVVIQMTKKYPRTQSISA